MSYSGWRVGELYRAFAGSQRTMRPMLKILRWDDAEVEALCRRADVVAPDTLAAAAAIVQQVREHGDAAVAELTRRFDGRSPPYEIDRPRWEAEAAGVAPDVTATLARAARRIADFHERQREGGYVLTKDGVRSELRVEPLARVGLYVPGGRALYPS